MKKFFLTLIAAIVAAASLTAVAACDKSGDNAIYVDTNAYFAPFEYYGGKSGTEIMGVDVDIMNLVGKKLGKEVKFVNTDFDIIIDNVASGKQYDCGAAGITWTEDRAAKVDFSDPYFTSVQYVVFKKDYMQPDGKTADDKDFVLWSSLAGKKLGVQRDTTGDIYAGDEIKIGVLKDSGATVKQFDNAQLAVDALALTSDLGVNAVIVDELPAKYITSKNSGVVCYPLHYDAETATTEAYAICVTKGNDELLNAINEVLAELGTDGVNALVSKHFGLE